jgi:hypothetical protein
MIVAAATLVGVYAQAPSAVHVLDDAAQALGGRDRIEAIRTIVIEGEGVAPYLGQNRTPDGELPLWKVTDFKRSIDLPNRRIQTQQVRTAQFLFPPAEAQRQNQGLDGDVAYDVLDRRTVSRAPAAAVRCRRIEVLHHPMTLVRAALEPGAKIGGSSGSRRTCRFTAPSRATPPW